MKKLCHIAVGALTYALGSSLVYASGLAALKMNGTKMEVKEGDIMALLINIGSGVVGFVFGAICVYSLVKTVWDTWHSIGEYRSGKKDSLASALEPLVTNGSLALITFAIAVYTSSNFLTWMGGA